MKSLCLFLLLFCFFISHIHSKEVPFDPSRGIVEVPVTINGAVIGKFGVDTGADRLYVDKTFAAKHELPIRKRSGKTVVGVDGQSEAAAVDLRSFDFAGNSLHDITATIIDIDALVKDKRFGHPDGLIGYELLQRCYVTVDYESKTIDLQMEEPGFLQQEVSFEIIPFDVQYHFILVDALLNDSVEARFILDYCASFTTITREIADLLGLKQDAPKGHTVSTFSVGSELSSSNVRVLVDDLTNLKERVGEIKIDGLLGANMLFRHKITVDYKRERLYIHF